jgi:hypothetical protein
VAEEAVFPIRYPTDTTGLAKGVTELERLRAALQEDQKQIAGLQKAMASLKLDPDVQSFHKMQDELKKLGIEEDKAAKKLKDLQDKRADMVKKGASAEKLADFDTKGGEAVGKLWQTQERIQGLKKSLAAIETKPAVRQFKDLGLALKDSEGQLAANQSNYLALGGDMTKMGDSVKSGFDKFAEGSDQAGLGVGGLKAKFEALKALGPAGAVVAIVVAVVALGIALAKTTYDLTKFVVEAGDAARSMGIMMEAAAGSQAGGRELGAMVRRLRNDFAGSREEIAGMVLELRRSGLQGAYLEKTVRLAGIATKTMGDAAAGTLKGLVERGALTKRFVLNPFDLRGTGIAFDDVARQLTKMTGRTLGTVRGALQNGQVKLADGIVALEAAVKLRLGDLAKRQLIALPEQINRARENLKDIFSGIDPGRFLAGLASVLELLDETTETGKTLRTLAKTIFQPFIDFVGSNVFPLIRGFLLGATLGIIELSIAALKAYIWFKKTFGDVSLFKGIDGAKLAFYAGTAAVFALVAAVGVLIAIFVALGSMVAIVTAPIWAIPAAVGAAIAAVMALKSKIAAALTPDKGAVDAGSNITNGVVNGIKDGTPAVDAAMKDMAKSGVKAFESELKIASPSKVLAKTSEIGIGGGVVKGVDASQDAVSDAMSRLVTPSDVIPKNGAMVTGKRQSDGTFTFQFGDIYVQSNGQGGIDKPSFVQQLVESCEDAIRQLGLTPRPA